MLCLFGKSEKLNKTYITTLARKIRVLASELGIIEYGGFRDHLGGNNMAMNQNQEKMEIKVCTNLINGRAQSQAQ